MHAATILALLPLAAVAAPSRRAQPAPLIKPRGATLVADKYIVRLKNEAKTGALQSVMKTFSADADHVYNFAGSETGSVPYLRGFASTLNATELESLQNDPDVDFIEQDAIVTIKATQRSAPWGLARLSSTAPGSTTYSYDESAGEGTCAYIVDTGIDIEHPDFEGRATFLANFADSSDTDGQGHGTHVAGTVGSATYGVAKKTKLFAVKVLDSNGEGTNSGVIAGMDFVATDAAGQTGCAKGVVVNMSLGGQTSTAVNQAAAAIVKAGHFLAVAAGNEAADASTSSPASEESVCTVGATTKTDALAEYSNFGASVDILAPGTNIMSTWPGGKTNTISGTSMASPHIAGLAAYLLGLGSAPSDPVQLCSYIADTALDGAISQVPRQTVNKLANNGFAGNGTAKATDGSVVGRQLNRKFAPRA
ncbi:subtilase [Colletotrichum scovillei]|uniref:Cuticle-degrading protease n=1 Tax=Colletotrichum scovillei TaxID=1209932 RepID=A0A9P7QPW0_9PEZI|nr:subtilase [Colletotrichum scovillei]KAF4784063.1 subtilase [Colletotrichum scovillei]KAG7038056.1 Cuticle-degrading protease [Colletotrichum scovillei]KAG7040397.1 Cuticle-degrading protease [Colletotrichum scovillei]KAG7060446.1 Cuticle-degrading protease [Colletotrichum scovillei]